MNLWIWEDCVLAHSSDIDLVRGRVLVQAPTDPPNLPRHEDSRQFRGVIAFVQSGAANNEFHLPAVE
jgi:hypothetical protein